MEHETVEIFRNCGFEFPLLIEDEFGFPEDLDGWNFGLVIAPTQPNRSFGPATLTNTTPVVASGLAEITFVLLQGDTALLSIGTAYEYRVMIQAPLSSPQVVRAGRIRLKDAPSMPVTPPESIFV